jgi:hypothetical protein
MTRNTERFFLEKVLFLISYYYVAFFVVLLHGTLIHIFSYILLFYHLCVWVGVYWRVSVMPFLI